MGARSCFTLVLIQALALTTFAQVTCPGVRIQDKSEAAAYAAQYPNCEVVNGNMDILCSQGAAASGGEIDTLDFMSSVQTIKGWLRVQDCRMLQQLYGLESLRTIHGGSVGNTPLSRGLYIWNNDALLHIKQLEGLESINTGGVTVRYNDDLCYTDLFLWYRIIPDAEDSLSPLITVDPPTANCLSKQCDDSCTCGFCGGPGKCTASMAKCPDDNIAWIAAPIVIGVVLVGLLIAFIVVLCKRDDCVCECYCSLKNPVPEQETIEPIKLKKTRRNTSSDDVIPLKPRHNSYDNEAGLEDSAAVSLPIAPASNAAIFNDTGNKSASVMQQPAVSAGEGTARPTVIQVPRLNPGGMQQQQQQLQVRRPPPLLIQSSRPPPTLGAGGQARRQSRVSFSEDVKGTDSNV